MVMNLQNLTHCTTENNTKTTDNKNWTTKLFKHKT